MRISIVTVSYNSAETIEDTIQSVIKQDYADIEYILIDGKSKDTTMQIIEKYRTNIAQVISEPDKGIYDAINKGIQLASGEVVAILNSDDFYIDSRVISDVMRKFSEEKCDCLYGDLQYVDRIDTNLVKRNWKSGAYQYGMFFKGWMPPHPSFFIRREFYAKYGLFNLQLKSAADYELMLRMLHVHKLVACYLPRVLVKMRVGGKSNLSLMNRLKANREDQLAWKLNGIKPKFYTLLLKPLSKIGQFLGN